MRGDPVWPTHYKQTKHNNDYVKVITQYNNHRYIYYIPYLTIYIQKSHTQDLKREKRKRFGSLSHQINCLFFIFNWWLDSGCQFGLWKNFWIFWQVFLFWLITKWEVTSLGQEDQEVAHSLQLLSSSVWSEPTLPVIMWVNSPRMIFKLMQERRKETESSSSCAPPHQRHGNCRHWATTLAPPLTLLSLASTLLYFDPYLHSHLLPSNGAPEWPPT